MTENNDLDNKNEKTNDYTSESTLDDVLSPDKIIEPINFIKCDSDLEEKVNDEQKKVEKKKERENWRGKADFFLSALAYAVGLGAVWRFPYLCYKNGGGVFLIPYFIILILIGIPLVFLELSVGQFTSSGILTCWRLTPIFRGIGLSMFFVNSYFCIYYNMILAYSIYYLYFTFSSLTNELPWAKCNSKWSLANCFDEKNSFNVTLIDCSDSKMYLKCNDGLCYSPLTKSNLTATCFSNATDLISLGVWKPAYPSQHFWQNVVLERSNSIDETGHIVWQLVIALFIAWLFVYMMVINGIKVSGKLVYFTSLFPYVVLLILGVRGWLLPGADIGIKFYIYPEFERLKDYTVWIDAAVQIFFTLSVAYGGLIALSSYNTFNTNIMRDAILVTISNCLTSVFAGFVIFAYLGYLAFKTGQEIKDVVQAGQGLAYVVYPFAVTTIKGGHIWAILFFIMMLILGIDTMMASVETLITSIFDILPKLRKTRFTRVLTITVLCLLLFSGGLLFCTQSGTYWVEIFDTYSGNWAILLIAVLECLSVAWFYGFEKFKKDISAMLGEKITNNYFFNIWRVLWSAVSPTLLIAVVVFSWYGFKGLEIDGYKFPYWSNLVGNLISITTLSGVFIWAIFAIIDALCINKRPIKSLFVADHGWRPLKQEHRVLVNLIHDKVEKNNEEFKGLKNEGYDIAEIEKF